jgi:hypothetical protein
MTTSLKKFIVLFALLILLMFITLISFYKQKNINEKLISESTSCLQLSRYYNRSTELNEPNLCNQLVIRLLWNDLEKFTQNYYKNYLDIKPTISDYDTQVKTIAHDNNNYVITFLVSPYIGPHLYLAEDEIVLNISGDETSLKNYSHIEIFELPDRYKHHLKKPL